MHTHRASGRPLRAPRRQIERPLAVAVGADREAERLLERCARDHDFCWRALPSSDAQGWDDRRPEVAFLLGAETLTAGEALRHWARETVLIVDPDDATRGIDPWRSDGVQVLYKPLDPRFLGSVLGEVADDFRLRRRYAQGPDGGALPLDRLGRLHGSAPLMRKLHRRMHTIAPGDASVLIYGEPGTGRSLTARTLHELSARAQGPFVSRDCAVRVWNGAATAVGKGADGWCAWLEAGRGGTLFLEEICALSVEQQEGLLCALRETADAPAPVRLMASSAREPLAALREGHLGQALYDRLAQFVLRLPALRERGDDILGLSRLFLDELNAATGEAKRLSAAAADMLRRYPWPGNTAELKRALEQAHAAAAADIEPHALPASVRAYDLLERDEAQRPGTAASR
ncbi:MAG: sigma-54-dependent transcriptional regulator [Pseudomonadota bacterium]